jgi:hypothetical protein
LAFSQSVNNGIWLLAGAGALLAFGSWLLALLVEERPFKAVTRRLLGFGFSRGLWAF